MIFPLKINTTIKIIETTFNLSVGFVETPSGIK